MGVEFQDNLASWAPYSTFVGTAAATLLGLLFVAVSLRLDIFRGDDTADVRDFARLTLLSFLTPLIVAGLALMPHDQPLMLAIPILVITLLGVAALIHLCREWVRLNPTRTQIGGYQPWQWQGWLHMCLLGLAYAGLGLVAVLLLRGGAGAGGALLVLSVVEGWLLVVGTLNAWVMLTNAGAAGKP